MSNFLELKNISKSFITETEIKVLKKLSYTFKKGKVYSLMGPSGAGKSTLLNLISLIDKPSNGSLKFNNQTIDFEIKIGAKKFTLKTLRHKLKDVSLKLNLSFFLFFGEIAALFIRAFTGLPSRNKFRS